MRPKQSTIKQIKQAGCQRAISILFILALALPIFGLAAESAPVTINLLQLNRLESSATKTTVYLKRLIEQRTNQRVKLTVVPHQTRPGPPNSQQIEMAVTDENPRAGDLAKAIQPSMKRVDGKTNNNYQLFIDVDLWNRLADELKIIIQGAIKDSLAYHRELEAKK